MERVLRGLHWKTPLIYLDDVIVYSANFEDHLNRLTTVLRRFRAAGLKRKLKCELYQKQVQFLGQVVSSQGIATDPAKVAAIQDWLEPQCVTPLRLFLGTVGYYRRFLADSRLLPNL